MITDSIQRLEYLTETIPVLLTAIPEEQFSFKPAINKWSKKEILGHLIDSATNNHQRFIRAQFENVPVIFYDQDNWNKFSGYNRIGSKHLVHFWTIYNRHLIELLRLMPKENLTKECNTGGEKNVTIEWLIDDYVEHMEYHLRQIVSY